jgi:hypothetical protein
MWWSTVDYQRYAPGALWSAVSRMLSHSCVPAVDSNGVDCFHEFLKQKVVAVHAATSDTSRPSHSMNSWFRGRN